MADNTPAVEAVMRADKERWALLEEEKALLKQLDEEPDEVKDARLAEVGRGGRRIVWCGVLWRGHEQGASREARYLPVRCLPLWSV